MIDLKNEFRNIKNDNHNIKQELIMLKIDKSLDHQQIDNEKMSTRMEMNPVNKPFFLKKVLLITLNLVLFTNWFLQNGLQKLKLLFLLIIISLLLLWLILVRI